MKTKTELPDAFEALLPWYATGRLSTEDRAVVAQALESREDLALQLRLIEEDRDATIRVNEALGAPGGIVWDRICAVTLAAAEPPRVRLSARISRWLRLEAAAPRSRLAWAAIAIVVALQGVAIFSLLPSSGGSHGFQTASAPAAVATGAQAMVAFAPETRLDQVAALLADAHATIVDGPRGGFYKIRFGAGPLDKPALDAQLAKLRANAIVKMAVPTGAGG